MLARSILREDRENVRYLSFNRPPANSLTLSLLEDLIQDIQDAGRAPEVRCVVLSSTTPKYFSAGLDLEELLGLPDRSRMFERLIAAHRAIATLPKPTVAAIEGTAFLGGFIIALACDWRWAAVETGKVALSEIRLGLSPTLPLIRLVLSLASRPEIAKSMVLKGETLRAEEAFQGGLVDELMPAAGFMETVSRSAVRLAKLPSEAYAAIKRDVRASLLPDEGNAWVLGFEEFKRLLMSDEAVEGLRAMQEKRKPRWE